ncbi:MAG: tetratricopeptide repeat protein [Bacteroidales bacterium]
MKCNPIIACGVLFGLATSCSSLKSMQDNADKINFNVVPQVLETKGDQVTFDLTANFPEKYFLKNATLKATPVLRYADGETDLAPISFQGDNIRGNSMTISYDNGGSYNYDGKIDYDKTMRRSELYIDLVAYQKNKTLNFEPIKVADGVVATSTLLSILPLSSFGEHGFERTTYEDHEADIHFLVNRFNLDSNKEMASDDIRLLKFYLSQANWNDKQDIEDIEVSGYASPEGKASFNERLSKSRKDESEEFMADQLLRLRIEGNEIRTKFTAEDWEGFKQYLEKSDIEDKELILRVLSMYDDPEVREREMRNLAQTFDAVADEVLPKLRRSRITTRIKTIGKSDEELVRLANTDPGSLTEEELLYAATIGTDNDRKLLYYNTYIRMHPDEWQGYNNKGCTLVKKGLYADAKKDFEKAQELNPTSAIIKNNLGAIALYDGDLDKAEKLLSDATGKGINELDYNLGTLYLSKGDYAKAASYLKGTNSSNEALVNILSERYSDAEKALENAGESALNHYLMAIIGARVGNISTVCGELQKAIAMDETYRDVAKTDVEFIEYANTDSFKSVVR